MSTSADCYARMGYALLGGLQSAFPDSVGLFKRVENQLLQCDGFDEIMENAKNWPRCMVEHNELLKAGFQGVPVLRRRDLLQSRDVALQAVTAEDEAQRRRIAARNGQKSPETRVREAKETTAGDADPRAFPNEYHGVEHMGEEKMKTLPEPVRLQTLEEFCDLSNDMK